MKKIKKNCLLLILCFGFSTYSNAGAKKVELKNLAWVNDLKKADVKTINLCGNSSIQLNKRSIARDFIIGNPPRGFLFSDLISIEEYWRILKTKNLEEAKAEFKEQFGRATLWVVTPQGVKSLGHPNEFEFPFTATIKDCIEGARTTLGMDCSRHTGATATACCTEKFVGPKISWKGQAQMFYSPDPSIRIRLEDEKPHRFCHVESIEL